MKSNTKIPAFDPASPENHFLASADGLRTYEDLHRYTSFFQHYLLARQTDSHKSIVILADPTEEIIFIIASCWILGIPFVCINPETTVPEVRTYLELIDYTFLIVDESHKNMVPEAKTIELNELSITSFLDNGRPDDSRSEQAPYRSDHNPEQVFGYFFTSGTTGNPKLVPLKRRQMLFAAKASTRNFKPDVNHFWLLCLPVYHISGVSIILRSILYGSGIYFMDKFNREMVVTFLSENTLFQVASMVPTMLKRLLEIPVFTTHKKFKAILLGGGHIPSGMVEEAIEKGIPLVPSYGMTETCAQIAANPILKPSGLYPPIKSVGNIFEPNEIEIRDQDHKVLGVNNSGTIWLRGPQIFDTYANPGKESEYKDDNGWFNTGDYGHINANGQLFIESRRSDVIITGGENVSPFEIELELENIPAIREAAVLGIPDDEWGEKIVAVLVPETGKLLNLDTIRDELKNRITPFKIPKKFVESNSLPRSDSGKILKKELLKYFD